MDNNQFRELSKLLEAQNKKLDQVVDLLKSMDKKTLEPGGLESRLLKIQEKSKSDNESFLKNAFNVAVFANISSSLDKIQELLKAKLK